MSSVAALRNDEICHHNHVTLVDGQSTFSAFSRLRLALPTGCSELNYHHLRKTCDAIRNQNGFGDANLTVASFSFDLNSTSQAKFQTAISHAGYRVDPVDFRLATVTTVASQSDATSGPPRVQSLASRIANLLGKLSVQSSLKLLVVSNSFELAGALQELAGNRESQVGLAFFDSLLDERWRRIGIGTSRSSIQYLPLDDQIPFLFQCHMPFPSINSALPQGRSEVTGLSIY